MSFQYLKNESRLAVSLRCNLIWMLSLCDIISFRCVSSKSFHSIFILSYVIMQCLRTVTLADILSNLSLITVVFRWYFINVSRKWSEEASIFNRLLVYENIHEGFSFLVISKADFHNNVLLQISLWCSPVSLKLESYCLKKTI